MSSVVLRGVNNINFLHIPKNGGSSVHGWLITHYGPKTNCWSFKKHPKLSVFTEGYGPAFTFTIVRNPWDRFVSMFHWGRKWRPDNGKSLFNIGNEDFLKQNNFDKNNMPDFEWMASNIDKIVRADGVTGLIARNQAGWIDGPMDYIMKFENINEDIKPIMDMMGVQGTTLPHINKTMHADYRLYYNDNTRKLIAKAFEEDIERFKYQF